MAESKGKILIVDDEKGIRDSVSALLKRAVLKLIMRQAARNVLKR